MAAGRGLRQVNEWNPDEREIATTVNLMLQGRANNTGEFTLTPNASLTVVEDNLFQTQMVPVLAPASASAAQAQAYVSDRKNGLFTISHLSAPETDQRFLYVRVG